ncbi:hypothetical protein F5Y00DRAFT_227580 [Daldinia vernicosa]|uniref:uncharacterized protein n=1 Tax=Daldinia vernicosa TaxID=114800 RepID=UPI002007E604|nr:uncharacterized protein F5Y00DRAFT_227580 [Daldinia vernicosa]KAI0852211.1 hypothetical protein F5Y00DRAFT_227580 [Daldinia vernicosa]
MIAGRFITTTARSSVSAVRGRIAYPYYRPTPTFNSHLSNQSTRIAASKFSTSSSGLSAKKPANEPSKQQSDETPPMGFSFEGLGMTRRTKIAVVIIISIFATMETIFYIRWFWGWYSGTEDDETESKA